MVYRCRLRPSDGEDYGKDYYSENITIENSKPNIIISSPKKFQFFEIELIKFDASETTDADSDEFKFFWNSDIGGKLSEKPIFEKKLIVGTHKITLLVNDTEAESEKIIELLIKPKPEAIIEEIQPNPAYFGESVEFNGKASGEANKYLWESNIDGFLSEKMNFKTNKLSRGFHEISFSVGFDEIRSEKVFLELEILNNKEEELPLIICSLSKNSAVVDEVLWFNLSDSGFCTHFFIDFGDGTNSGWTERCEISHIYKNAGAFQVLIRAKNREGLESEKDILISVNKMANKGEHGEKDNNENSFVGFESVLSITLLIIISLLKKERNHQKTKLARCKTWKKEKRKKV